MASLVQYPLPGSFKPTETIDNDDKKFSNPIMNNEKSEVMALALGVQVKTGQETPPLDNLPMVDSTKFVQQNHNFKNQNEIEMVKTGRNKFETEKPDNNDENRSFKNGSNFRGPDRRRLERRPPFRRLPFPPFVSGIRRERGRYPPYRRYNRSPRRSRSPRRQRSRTPRRTSKRSPSKEEKIEKRHSRSRTPDDSKNNRKQGVDKKIDDTEEKYKKLLYLRKQMELLELKKKKEIEQKLLEEKHRKAKEEADMLEKAKKAKREAIEKEKLMKTYKVLQELDKNTSSKGKKTKNYTSDSSSSYSSSSSSSSRYLSL